MRLRCVLALLATCLALTAPAHAQEESPSIDALVRQLLAGSPEAESRLAALGDDAAAALVRATDTENLHHRRTLLQVLVRLAPNAPKAKDGLVTLLHDPARDVREHAAASLARLGAAPRHLTALLRALRDKSCGVRRAVATAIGTLGPDGLPAADALAAFLVGPNALVAEAAPIDPRVLGDEEPPSEVRAAAIDALVRVAPGEERTLAVVLECVLADRRLTSRAGPLFRALGAGAIAALSRAVLDPTLTDEAAHTLVHALVEIGRPALPTILTLVRTQPLSPRTRDLAQGLARIPLEPADVATLAAMFPQVHDDLTHGLGLALARAGAPGIAALRAHLADAAPSVRRAAIRGLWEVPPSDETVYAIAALADGDPDPGVRDVAHAALEGFRRIAERSRPPEETLDARWTPVLEALRSEMGPAKRAAVRALGEGAAGADPMDARGYAVCIPLVLPLLAHAEAEVRGEAIIALGRLGRHAPRALDACGTGLADVDATVRAHAVAAFTTLGPRGVMLLEPHLDDERHPMARATAAQALGELGPIAHEAVPTLVRRLRDPDASVRAIVARALGRIGVATSDVVAELVRTRGDVDANVQDATLFALGQLRERASEADRARIDAARGSR